MKIVFKTFSYLLGVVILLNYLMPNMVAKYMDNMRFGIVVVVWFLLGMYMLIKSMEEVEKK